MPIHKLGDRNPVTLDPSPVGDLKHVKGLCFPEFYVHAARRFPSILLKFTISSKSWNSFFIFNKLYNSELLLDLEI